MAIRTIDPSGTIAAGKFGITRTARPLRVETDPEVLAAGPAAAIATAIANGIRNISDPVAPATAVYREKARKAFSRGAPWALERYNRPPAASDMLFNDSGELADDVQVDAGGDGSYQISVPTDRMQAAGGGDLAEQLGELVPAIAGEGSDIDAAVEASADAMITVG